MGNMMKQIDNWFLLTIDLSMIICSSLSIVLTIFFLIVIFYDRTCHTKAIFLVANSFFSILILSINSFGSFVYSFRNDFNQIEFADIFCYLYGYLGYSLSSIQNLSYFLQSLYSYTISVYPYDLFWQTYRTQILLIIFSWLFGFIYPLQFLLTNQLKYDVDNQMCQIPLRFTFSIVFITHCVFVIPMISILFVYMKLVRYIRRLNKRTIPLNVLRRTQCQLKLVRHLVILVGFISMICFPYAVFVFMSFFMKPPKYHLRIAVGSINFSSLIVIFIQFQFTDSLRTAVKRIFKCR